MNNKYIRFFVNISWIYPLIILVGIYVFGVYTEVMNKDSLATASDYLAYEESMKSESETVNESESTDTSGESSKDIESTSGELTAASLSLSVTENGNYTSKEELALYIHIYNRLPNNYISKKEASAAGWDQAKDNLDSILPGMSIGGDEFGNAGDKLPKETDRKYYEADVDYNGGSRSSKRIVYSNDGLIFYTEDSYENFERLY